MSRQAPSLSQDPARAGAPSIAVDAAVIRFAGDASDGMHMVGVEFSRAAALHGNATYALPDFPAEIRAPAGVLAGASSYQVHFANHSIHTPGDHLNMLVAMNPASLKANGRALSPGGILLVNADSFTVEELEKAGYAGNPLVDGSLSDYRIVTVLMNQLNREAVAPVNLIPREAARCVSFFPLGMALWIFELPLEPTLQSLRETYKKNPAMVEASARSLAAGYHHAETSGLFSQRFHVAKADVTAGRYRHINGIESLALGLLASAHQADRLMLFAGFPLTPASELLHRMFEWRQPNVKVVQAEDDIAAMNLALGASFGGALGVTATTGPGMSLQSDSLGLAVMSELPCVVINIQRAGPSAGMPSKTEQADLLQALYGRHGECPLVVLAMASPSDGFEIMQEAIRLAVRAMSPVIVLADMHLAQCAETWRITSVSELMSIDIPKPPVPTGSNAFLPYQRDELGVRPWALPGTPGLEHRTGGMEKEDGTGNVTYDPLNHERMVHARAQKIARLASEIPPLTVQGPADAELLVLGWGSTYGAIRDAVEQCQQKGMRVARAHLRHLSPLPANVTAVLSSFRTVLIPELNSGQLAQVLRANIVSLSKLQGEPFTVAEIKQKIESLQR
jgi:2-oxoglutarate ferredoxin oxidoreductase subunit alpha